MNSASAERRFANKISWSRNGFVAFSDLSSIGNLSITKLQAIEGTTWRLSPKRTYQIKPNAGSKLLELKLIQWSTSGVELAVVDEVGNLSILGTGVVKVGNNGHQVSCFEDIEVFYQDDVSSEQPQGHSPLPKNLKLAHVSDFMTEVLAFKWLNLQKPVIYSHPAVKGNNGAYSYGVNQYKAYGAFHPEANKSACFSIRRNGVLNFYYQTVAPGVEYRKVSCSLEPIGECLFDDASIGFNHDGSAIVATYSSLNHCLSVYLISLGWGSIKDSKVTMKVERLITESVNRIGKNSKILEFASLEVISTNFSKETDLSIILNFTGAGVGDGKSLVQRFEVSQRFDNLRLKNEDVSVDGYPNLKFLSEVVVLERITKITAHNFDFLLVFMTEEGEIQLRNRKSLKLHTQQDASISTLLDVGFHFEKPAHPPETVAFSPCMTGFVSLKNSALTYQSAVKSVDGGSLGAQDSAALAAATAHLFATACFNNACADELTAAMQGLLAQISDSVTRESLIVKILEELYSSIKFDLNVEKDQIEKVFINPPSQRLLAFQYSLGKLASTNEQASIAMAALNIRQVAFRVMMQTRSMFHLQQRIAKKGNHESLTDGVHRSEGLLSIVGAVNWFVEFLIFTIQELINLTVNPGHPNIVLAMLMAKVPRTLISYSIAALKRIDAMFRQTEEQYRMSKMHIALAREMFGVSFERFKIILRLVDLESYEKFLNEIDGALVNSSGKESNTAIEQELILTNKIPEVYKGKVAHVLLKFQEHFMHMNLSQLFFHDTTWLGFQLKANKLPKGIILKEGDKVRPTVDINQTLVDGVTKNVLVQKEKLLKCVRCEYLTSGLPPSESFNMLSGLGTVSIGHWTMAYARSCICGSSWVHVCEDEIV